MKKIAKYILLTLILTVAALIVPIENIWLRMLYRSIFVVVFVVYLVKNDLPLSTIPIVKNFVKKIK